MAEKTMNMRCTKCGEFFIAEPPKGLDEYSLKQWGEGNRLCDTCAGVNRYLTLAPKIVKNYDPNKWDPELADERKIGLGGTVEDSEGS